MGALIPWGCVFMKKEFTCEFVLDRPLYYEYAAGLARSYKKLQYVYAAVFAAFFAVLAAAYFRASLTASLVCTLIAALCAASIAFGDRFTARMNFSRLLYLHGGEPQISVSFDAQRISNSARVAHGTIAYRQINRILETKRLLILVIEDVRQGHKGVIVAKAALHGGTVEELKRFLKARCVNLRRQGVWDFARFPR